MGGIFLDFNSSQKKCGFCGESIPAGAGRCPYCGSILEVTIDNSYRINADESGNTPQNTEQTQSDVRPAQDANTDQPGVNPSAQGTREPRNEQPQAFAGNERPYYQNRFPDGSGYVKPPLSNGLKVFLAVLFTIIPGIGQLAGIITAIVFMSADGDKDRKSFGVALLVANLVMFVLACIGCFVFSITMQSLPYQYNY